MKKRSLRRRNALCLSGLRLAGQHVLGVAQQRQVGQVGDDGADRGRHVDEAVQEAADLDEAADDGQHDTGDIDADDQLGEGIGLVRNSAIIHLVGQVADAADAEPEDHDVADSADQLGDQADDFLVGEDAGDDASQGGAGSCAARSVPR